MRERGWMLIRKARRNPVKGVTTFYVQRAAPRSELHIVQRIVRGLVATRRAGSRRREQFFCDCRDFMCRKLPHIGTNTFSGCIHIKETHCVR